MCLIWSHQYHRCIYKNYFFVRERTFLCADKQTVFCSFCGEFNYNISSDWLYGRVLSLLIVVFFYYVSIRVDDSETSLKLSFKLLKKLCCLVTDEWDVKPDSWLLVVIWGVVGNTWLHTSACKYNLSTWNLFWAWIVEVYRLLGLYALVIGFPEGGTLGWCGGIWGLYGDFATLQQNFSGPCGGGNVRPGILSEVTVVRIRCVSLNLCVRYLSSLQIHFLPICIKWKEIIEGRKRYA